MNRILYIIILTLFSFQNENDQKTELSNISQPSIEKNTTLTEIEIQEIEIQENKSEIALKFINDYVDNCNSLDNNLEMLEWVNSNNYFTTDFKNNL